MVRNFRHRSHFSVSPLSPDDVSVVLANAQALQLALRSGLAQPLLRGMNLGLMCETDDGEAAMAFRRAAETLGARVAHIRPSLSALSTPQAVQHTAQMLGRLYDAVECQGVPSTLVQRLGEEAGVPVFDGVATAQHPTARLVALVDGDASDIDGRSLVLQAVLLGSLA